VADRWLNCELDEEGVQVLQDWKEGLQSVEESVVAIEEDLDTKLDDFTATEPRKPSLQFGTEFWPSGNRLILTSVNDGVEDPLTIYLTNPGPNFNYNALDPGTWNWQITDLRTLYGIDLLFVELTTDANGNVVTGAAALCLLFAAEGYGADFTCQAPDFFIFGFLIFDFPLPTNEGAKHFTGGGDAPLQGVIKGLNSIYQGTGLTPTTAMEKLDVPVVTSSSTTAEVLSEITDIIVLSTGTRLRKTEEDTLSSMRALWALLGADTDAASTVLSIVGGTSGDPSVVWTQDVTITTTIPICDGGGTQSTTTTEVVGNYNTKPTNITSDMTPRVWWLHKLSPDINLMELLISYGLDNDQVRDALDENQDYTYIIPENIASNLATVELTDEMQEIIGGTVEIPSASPTSALTAAELSELLTLTDVVGVELTTITIESALDSLADSEATAANGYISPSFNFPGGKSIADALSPEKSMSQDIQDMNDSQCVSPLGKQQITTLLAMISATIDSVATIIERARNKISGTLNTVSGVLANIDNVVNNLPAVSCLIGLDISVKGPQIDLMMPNIEAMSVEFKDILADLEAIIDLTLPKLCQVDEAVRSLLGPELGLVECLVPGLTNDLVNKVGLDLDLEICIENPFDVEGVLQEVQGKINAQVNLLNSMLADVRSISSRLSLNVSIEDQTDSQAAMGGCSDPALGAIVSRIKSTFGA